eukprot:GHVU01192361.1.p4 GENE.GHVU01192361.1~~GHVU01192361.1.p4  ORF type:complete len:146 (-),score=14.66 GHVU01192361.1:750-1187(-)
MRSFIHSTVAAHIQQLATESNREPVTTAEAPPPVCAGEIMFEEPGTDGQHMYHCTQLLTHCFLDVPVLLPPPSLLRPTVPPLSSLHPSFFPPPSHARLSPSARHSRPCSPFKPTAFRSRLPFRRPPPSPTHPRPHPYLRLCAACV